MSVDELSLLQAAFRAAADNRDLALLLARKFAQLGMWPEVADTLLPLLQAHPPSGETPQDGECVTLLARALLETGRIAAAEDWFERVQAIAAESDIAVLEEAFSAKGIEPRGRLLQTSVKDELTDLSCFHPLDLKTRSQVSFADVGGMDDLKDAARMKIILPFQKAELFARYGRKPGGGLLLYGPPGCGKTHFAKAVAGECGVAFFAVGIHDILNLYVGNSERNVRALFETARAQKPAILFIDEIDALGRKRDLMRTSSLTSTINAFLSELDGLGNDNTDLLVLGATNAPWDIDPAFKRPGRFDQRLFVPPPDAAGRAAILRLHFAGKPCENLDFDRLARATEHHSGADLAHLAQRAADRVLAEILKTGRERPIGMADVSAVLDGLKPSTLEWLATARNYVEYANEEGAFDEIGAWIERAGGRKRMGF